MTDEERLDRLHVAVADGVRLAEFAADPIVKGFFDARKANITARMIANRGTDPSALALLSIEINVLIDLEKTLTDWPVRGARAAAAIEKLKSESERK